MDTLLKTTLRKSHKSLKNLVPPRGIEPLAPGLGKPLRGLWQVLENTLQTSMNTGFETN